MSIDNEIQAMIILLDDPDSEVFESVAKSLVNFGPDIIPQLEKAWEFSTDEILQQRIENLIQDIQNSNTKKVCQTGLKVEVLIFLKELI